MAFGERGDKVHRDVENLKAAMAQTEKMDVSRTSRAAKKIGARAGSGGSRAGPGAEPGEVGATLVELGSSIGGTATRHQAEYRRKPMRRAAGARWRRRLSRSRAGHSTRRWRQRSIRLRGGAILEPHGVVLARASPCEGRQWRRVMRVAGRSACARPSANCQPLISGTPPPCHFPRPARCAHPNASHSRGRAWQPGTTCRPPRARA